MFTEGVSLGEVFTLWGEMTTLIFFDLLWSWVAYYAYFPYYNLLSWVAQ